MARDIKKFHQTVASVISDPKMGDVLQELDTDSNARKNAATDPKGYLKKKGLAVSDEMTAQLKPDNWSLQICAWGICLTINA